ncbi:MAG: ABC transporter permease [Clostridiales Family XIII bacterium]|nr:ABC transporter permease [Clostridiales Family XIII bacterium]
MAKEAALKRIKSLIAIAIFFALWEALPRIGIIKPSLLPPFSSVVVAMVDFVFSGKFAGHLLISIQRSVKGFFLALAVAIPLGVAIGSSRTFAQYIEPLIQGFRQTAALALYPVFILFFGLGETSKVAIIFWASLWAVLINTISGVSYVNPTFVQAAQSMGASRARVLFTVILPDALPSIMTGVRLSATASILSLVAAEMIGSNSGLGFLIMNSQYNFQVPLMYAAILYIAIFGLVVNYALAWVEKKYVLSWKQG